LFFATLAFGVAQPASFFSTTVASALDRALSLWVAP